MISSKDIIFDGGKGLEPGMNAEIVLEWPRLLDDRIRLQLVLRVTITGSQDGVTEARIQTYDFRTRGPAEGPLIWRGYSGAALGPGRVASGTAWTSALRPRRAGSPESLPGPDASCPYNRHIFPESLVQKDGSSLPWIAISEAYRNRAWRLPLARTNPHP